MSVKLQKKAGGISQQQIEALINYNYIIGAHGLGYVPVSPDDLDETIASLSGLQAEIDAKVDKSGSPTGVPILQYNKDAISPDQNSYLMFVNQGGQIALKLNGIRVIIDPGYAAQFTKSRCEFTSGIDWDMGAQSVKFTTVNEFSVTTGSANTQILSMGTGLNTVFRPYSNSNSIIVMGQLNQTVPIFEVKRSDGTTVIQFKDVSRPDYDPNDTASQIGLKLQRIGIFG